MVLHFGKSECSVHRGSESQDLKVVFSAGASTPTGFASAKEKHWLFEPIILHA
jgi:hypothetical protein